MSMPRLLFHLSGLFDSPNMRGLSEDAVLWGLEVLTNWDVDYLKTHSETPKLYDSGVVYALPDQMTSKMTPADIEATRQFVLKRGASRDSADHVVAFLEGMEVFRDVPAVLQLGKVDCDNLSAFRTAELRLAGVKAAPYITWRDTSRGTTYHALVRWPDGTSEDPSLLLGLGGRARVTGRAEERRKNVERYEDHVEVARALHQVGTLDLDDAARQIRALGLLPTTKLGWDTWRGADQMDPAVTLGWDWEEAA